MPPFPFGYPQKTLTQNALTFLCSIFLFCYLDLSDFFQPSWWYSRLFWSENLENQSGIQDVQKKNETIWIPAGWPSEMYFYFALYETTRRITKIIETSSKKKDTVSFKTFEFAEVLN